MVGGVHTHFPACLILVCGRLAVEYRPRTHTIPFESEGRAGRVPSLLKNGVITTTIFYGRSCAFVLGWRNAFMHTT